MASNAALRHPLDPLSANEIGTAISVVRASHRNVQFNVVSLHEPRKAAMTRWLENRSAATKPPRVADVTVIAPGGKVGDGLVDLGTKRITQWQWVEGKQPIVSGPMHYAEFMQRSANMQSRSPLRSCRLWSLLFAVTPR